MRLLKEMAKRMIELCDGSLQGMASTMNLLTYYNDIFGGALKHELEILNGMMDHMLREGSRQNCTCNDYAIAMYAVLTKYEYYKGSREDFVNMMNRYFDIDVSYGALKKWLARNSVDFNDWNKGTGKTCNRQDLARDFKELIDKVRTYKSKNF